MDVKALTKLQTGFALAVFAAGAAVLIWQYRINARLQSEMAGLRRRAGETARLRADNQRLERSLAERDREDAELLRSRRQASRSGASQAGRSAAAHAGSDGVPLAAGLLPVESLGNAGRATARAAFATQLWAARTGDVDLEAAVLTFAPEDRAKLEALLAALPPDLRAQYDTPEKLMAFMLAGSPHPVGGMQVMAETDPGTGTATLQTEWQHADDTLVHQTDVQMQQSSDGWKMVVPSNLVDRASAYLRRSIGGP